MNKNRFLFATFLILFVGAIGVSQLAAAPQAVLANIKGKVEVKALNATSWTPAKEGMVINTLTTVSTGFDSTVSIVIDKTTIHVKPLTRMSIDKLVEDSGTVSTNCYLRVGSVQASVKSAEGIKQDFKVQSPYSTASVRGTEFEFDGFRLSVNEGRVAFLPGRPQRDVQVPPEVQAKELTDLVAAINSAPENPENAGKQAFVGAGVTAFVTVGPTAGVSDPKLSTDRSQLDSTANIKVTDHPFVQPVGSHATVDSHFGSLTITWN